jgi:hypothetical protein
MLGGASTCSTGSVWAQGADNGATVGNGASGTGGSAASAPAPVEKPADEKAKAPVGAARTGAVVDFATDDKKPSAGDTAWILASAALVLLMTPGLAFFYGGLVRSKNMLNTLLMSFAAMGVMVMVWVVAAYSIAFGSIGDMSGEGGAFVGSAANDYWGGLRFMFLNDVDTVTAHSLANTIPHQLFMVFQMMFFIITPALISGSLVERMKFSTYLVFISLWGLLVYAPVAHWVWNGGFIGAKIRPSTSPAARSSTSTRASRPWPALWPWANARATTSRRGVRTTCRFACWAWACCGSAGMASTRDRLWAPARWPRSPSSTPRSAPVRPC